MPRTLVLVRHSKAAWPEDVPDHERPLAGRGRRDSVELGRWLREHVPALDVALVSSARRTRETYQGLADALESPPDLQVTDAAYAASAGDLLDLVREIPGAVSAAMVIAHNPGIGTLARLLDDETTDVAGRDRMRLSYATSACAVFESDVDWAELDPGGARLMAYAVPRG